MRQSIGRAEAGITLVELSVVLVVVAIVAVAAYPLIGGVLSALSSKGAAEQVGGAIRLARQFAITNGVNHCIQFGGTPRNRYQIVADTDPTCGGGTAVNGYSWTDISQQETVATTAPNLVFSPTGDRILPPAGTGNAVFNVDTVPATCQSVVTVTIFGGVRTQPC